MRHQPIATDVLLALLWEGEKPIPFDYREPLWLALEKAVSEIYQEQHPKDKKSVNKYELIKSYQPPELGRLCGQIYRDNRRTINPWDYFQVARGSWLEGGPLIPANEPYLREIKAKMRRHFGESYEALVKHFVPHFQRLAQDYLPIK